MGAAKGIVREVVQAGLSLGEDPDRKPLGRLGSFMSSPSTSSTWRNSTMATGSYSTTSMITTTTRRPVGISRPPSRSMRSPTPRRVRTTRPKLTCCRAVVTMTAMPTVSLRHRQRSRLGELACGVRFLRRNHLMIIPRTLTQSTTPRGVRARGRSGSAL